MGTDLGKLMKLQRLSEEKIQYLVYQILKGLKVENSALVIQFIVFIRNFLMFFKCPLCSFTAVYSFCWYNSQGKLSYTFLPYMPLVKDCVHKF